MNLLAKYRIQILAFIKFLMPRSQWKSRVLRWVCGWNLTNGSGVIYLFCLPSGKHLTFFSPSAHEIDEICFGETLNSFFFNVIVICWSSFSHINHCWTVTSAYEAKHLGLLLVRDKYWLKHLCGERQQVCLLPSNVKCSLPLRRQKKKKTQPFSWVVQRGSCDNSDRRRAKREREGMCELVRGAKRVSCGSVMSHY